MAITPSDGKVRSESVERRGWSEHFPSIQDLVHNLPSHRLTNSFHLYYIVSMQRRKNDQHEPLGEFETLVLMAIMRLGNDAYGMRIHREIEERATRRCSFGALYTTLDRLEQKGYVSSRVGEKTAERGGRAKKYMRVTAIGSTAVKQAYRATVQMAEGLEPVLGGTR